jgi:hypothetical protein
LYGDPSKEGPFVLRLKLPNGFNIAPHRHGGAEILTVISGTFALGAGEDATKGEVTRLTAGSFTAMPAGMPHYVRAEGERWFSSTALAHGPSPTSIRLTIRGAVSLSVVQARKADQSFNTVEYSLSDRTGGWDG